jgi:tripartite-type tricarboxylate transporter receptor subunit TctC
MNLARRQFLAASAAALPAFSRPARAQTYPLRPVRVVVGFPAGGAGDILARLIGQWLQERIGQAFMIDNRPGAAGNVAAEAVAKASPDGYTLIVIGSPHVINATLYEKRNFNLIRDIAPVASIDRVPHVMEVNPSFPGKTVPEFIAYAKSNPGKINFASAGNGSPQHVAGELFKMMSGIDMVHVPYRGEAPALTDLLGGQVQVYFGTLPGSIEQIRADKLRAMAVTTEKRLEVLPNVPTVGDFLNGFEASSWQGIGVPKNTPVEIVEKLNKEINAGLADPKMKAQLADLGGTVLAGSPAEFGKLIAEDTDKWAKVIRAANIKAE